MAEQTCASEDCECELDSAGTVTKDGKKYCSEFCASSEGASLEDCECGHSDCA
jgi:hypothetical protein